MKELIQTAKEWEREDWMEVIGSAVAWGGLMFLVFMISVIGD